MQATAKKTATLNGIDTAAIAELVDRIKANPAEGIANFRISSAWKSGARTDHRVLGWSLGGTDHPKDFTISIDEPEQLCGTNTFANPQEYLMAAMNACLMATYVAACAVNGVELESLEMECSGDIDLRGFLAIDATVPAGYEEIDFTVRIKGNASKEQFEQIHKFVQQTSPNYYNIARPIRLNPKLIVEN